MIVQRVSRCRWSLMIVAILGFALPQLQADPAKIANPQELPKLPIFPSRVEFLAEEILPLLPQAGTVLSETGTLGTDYRGAVLGFPLTFETKNNQKTPRIDTSRPIAKTPIAFREGYLEINVGILTDHTVGIVSFDATIACQIDSGLMVRLRTTKIENLRIAGKAGFVVEKIVTKSMLATIVNEQSLTELSERVTKELHARLSQLAAMTSVPLTPKQIQTGISSRGIIFDRTGQRIAPELGRLTAIDLFYRICDGDKDGEKGGADLVAELLLDGKQLGSVGIGNAASEWWPDWSRRGPFSIEIPKDITIQEPDLPRLKIRVCQKAIAPRDNPHVRLQYAVSAHFEKSPNRPVLLLDYDAVEHPFNFPHRDPNANRYDLEDRADMRSQQSTPWISLPRPR